MGLHARNVIGLFGSVAIGTMLASMAAQAQDGAQTNESEKKGRVTLLDRLVLGAGVEKVAIDTPQSVTVVEQEDIDQEQATTVGDVLKRIPGVNTSGSDRVFGQTFNIRGIGAPESANEEGRIIVTVDGATKFYEQYRMGGFFSDPELYKKVEVLRGPASSTLYGSGALGGVINFVTKDASDFIAEGDSGALRLKGGFNSNRNGYLGSVIFAQRFGEDAEFLLAGNYRTADAYKTGNGSVVRSSDFQSWSGLAKATFNVGEEGKLRLSYQQWDSDADDQDYAQVGTQPIFGTVDRHVIDRTAVISYENPFTDNDWLDLKVSASFSDTNVDQTDASGAPMFGLTCATSLLFCDTEYGYQTWQFNVQNTSEWSGDNWENFLTYGWQTSYQIRTAESVTLGGTPAGINFHPEGTDLKTGVFVQNEFVWDERLTIIPGVRLDWHELTPDGSTGVTGSMTDTAVSPKIAAHYRFNDYVAVFGSIAHTERFPTIDEVFSTGGSSNSFLPSLGLEKEKSNNFEIGFALSGYDIFQEGDGVQLKTTGFYNDITDLISLNPALVAGPNFIPGYVNIDEARIYGVEVELAYDSDYVFASAGYSHVIGKDETTGMYLTTVAPHELALTIGGKMPEKDLKFGWKARFVAGPQDPARDSATPPPSGSTRFAESFNVHDVFLTWTPQQGQFAGWEANVGVENIFNEQYKEFLHNDASRGRTLKVSLSKQFGWQ
ncbi:TonB-dependent hemoglobin/transferrin/lactoferrin family receptor [Nitratireductor mangrovi]|uniref:TonB-dependent hemoglobin/transferrin/lactoferrin family receptor n=1 Tax=Nitratireductor mangrovi TaxID=2599600 RepID=A0A5B8L3J4_9HYPH|nr:TonB-dependent hemoglobin/transferrin/lactoferrin family receptor [Nitratireductor mangrovi]QDZ02561.1 TonB-dependent hemoglobin/transferrin/lactoferrin family receptor [Nitratireductor mangrovi]